MYQRVQLLRAEITWYFDRRFEVYEPIWRKAEVFMVQVADCGSVYEKLQEEASKEYPENEFQKRLETEGSLCVDLERLGLLTTQQQLLQSFNIF